MQTGILRRMEETNTDGRDYSEVSCAFSFWTDTTIQLYEVGFVGVHEKSPSNKFALEMVVLEEDYGEKVQEVKYPWTSVIADKGKAFSIPFTPAVKIRASHNAEIRFYLKPENDADDAKVLLQYLKGITCRGLQDKETGVYCVLGNSTAAINEIRYRQTGYHEEEH